jgi:hypothetical protein
LEEEKIKAVLELLQYDKTLPKPDPALQPLIPLGGEFIAVVPHLIISSRFERNLMALLARGHKRDYDATTNVLEQELLNDMKKSLSLLGFKVKDRVRLSQRKDLPDIDLAVYSERDNLLLLIEAKWVIQPAESSEVFSRAERVQEGVGQMRSLLEYSRANPRTVFACCFAELTMPSELQIEGCVCLRGYVGSSKNLVDDIAIIEERLLLRQIKVSPSLSGVLSWMRNRDFLPILGRDFKVSEIRHVIGPFTVFWTGLEILREPTLAE